MINFSEVHGMHIIMLTRDTSKDPRIDHVYGTVRKILIIIWEKVGNIKERASKTSLYSKKDFFSKFLRHFWCSAKFSCTRFVFHSNSDVTDFMPTELLRMEECTHNKYTDQ